jgi:glucose/mannose-6-phosphate isomerase
MKYQKDFLARFPEQVRYAIKHYEPHGLKATDFDNIILSGLGGSGIAGRIAKSYFYDTSTLPMEVVSDYNLPAFVGRRTLALMSSYSGDTEETISMLSQAKSKGCTIIALTTGGQLGEEAALNNYHIYKAETGFQPRMALGYSLTYLLLFFGEMFDINIMQRLEEGLNGLDKPDTFIDEASNIFETYKANQTSKIVVITDALTNPVGLRFCQQVQENAKGEAFLHELPESNHNVIESYYGKTNSFFLLLNTGRSKRTDLRFEFLKSLLKENGNIVFDMRIEPSLSSIMRAIYTLDWLALMIADFKEKNSSNIFNINSLKEFLGKHP